jgi:hypothetical protein
VLLTCLRVDGSLERELDDVLLPHEVAAVAAVGPSGAPSFVLQVTEKMTTSSWLSNMLDPVEGG